MRKKREVRKSKSLQQSKEYLFYSGKRKLTLKVTHFLSAVKLILPMWVTWAVMTKLGHH